MNPQAIERPNLPRRPTQIIGRDADIRALAEHLSARRFVTLRGPAGVGKTTMAVALAHELWNQFRDGIAFLDLARLDDPHQVVSAATSVLGLVDPVEDINFRLLELLRDRQLLLALDSCEHVVEAVAWLAEQIYQCAPSVAILATSRESLQAAGEFVFELAPVEIPLKVAPILQQARNKSEGFEKTRRLNARQCGDQLQWRTAVKMNNSNLTSSRRDVLIGATGIGAAALASTGLLSGDSAAAEGSAIRPFRIDVPETQLVDLRRRIAATRWPERETVNDHSQGVQLAKLQPLVRYWGTDYDWRKAEAKLNALPQFVTTIDGLDIQFIHVRSRQPNAMPLIMTHGWPGSLFELLKVVAPLTDPTAHGGRAEDAFHLVLPTYPGYGFSGKPQATGWGPDRVARAWHELMQRLGYKRYVSQGGDWGAIISEVMAVQAPQGLLGIHINMPGTVPPSVLRLIRNRDPVPSTFSEAEKVAFAGLEYFYRKGFGYAEMMNTRPQTLGYALADSPVGMLAFFYDKFTEWTYSGGEPEKAAHA